ncbi:MAG: dethiobiotin synthase [Elainella sp.]
MQSLLITGTAAQVGKTVVLTALMAYWQRYTRRSVGVMKPLDWVPNSASRDQPGANGDQGRSYPDAELFQQLFQLDQPTEQITPILLSGPALPPTTAEQTGLDLDLLWRQFQQLQQQHELVLLEGWGGLGSPLTAETTGADLAWDWRIPTILVVPVEPGAVAQAVAHVALANQARVHLKGIVLNEVRPCSRQDHADWVPTRLLQSLTRKPLLGCIPHLANPRDLNSLTQAAADLELELLLPGIDRVLLS